MVWRLTVGYLLLCRIKWHMKEERGDVHTFPTESELSGPMAKSEWPVVHVAELSGGRSPVIAFALLSPQ